LLPGRYTVRLTVGSRSRTQTLEVRQDPQRETPMPQLVERDSITRVLTTRIGEVHDAVTRVRELRTPDMRQVTGWPEQVCVQVVAHATGPLLVPR
jgi:hypothetical protein